MITENTLLILGAGASKPYGYPTAVELREQIIYKLLPLLEAHIRESDPNINLNHVPFIKKTKELIYAFDRSSTSSIDLFLTRNQDYDNLGREIICFLMAEYELNSKFREEVPNKNQDWYTYLYNRMTKEITLPEEIGKLAENQITILTFNYDRSLEYFLYESLFHSFITKRNEIRELMRNFKIIHIYGKMASLEWEGSNSYNYRSEYIKSNFAELSSNIKTIYNERDPAQDEISNIISEAKRIYFLGFGYAEENLKALGLDKPILHKGQQIYGTAYGYAEGEITRIKNLIHRNNKEIISEKFHLKDCDTLTLLRDHL